jgi:hypothetical protein
MLKELAVADLGDEADAEAEQHAPDDEHGDVHGGGGNGAASDEERPGPPMSMTACRPIALVRDGTRAVAPAQ